MTYIKINDQTYPATISGEIKDAKWDWRQSKTIELEMDYATAAGLFVDDLEWAIVYQPDSYIDPDTGDTITPDPEIYDNSEYSVAGPITDNRNGTVSVKMGKITDGEALAELMEAMA